MHSLSKFLPVSGLLAVLLIPLLPIAAAQFLPIADRQRNAPVCGDSCTFRLCNYDGTFVVQPPPAFTIFSGPGTTQRPFICRADGTIGRILRTGEVLVYNNTLSTLVRISDWSPDGLSPKFPGNFIRTFRIPSPVAGGRDLIPASTIGNGRPRGNQWSFLHDQCMVMPIRRYEIVNRDFAKVAVASSDKADDCVAFRTTAPTIHVELTWDTNDQLDMELTEPDGDVLNRATNARTEAGKVNELDGDSVCAKRFTQGKENIVYFPGGPIEEGMYSVKVIHYASCRGDLTSWKLRVLFNGDEQAVYSGQSSVGRKHVLKTVTFLFS